MAHNGWYVINDLEAFIDKTRAIVFNSFGKKSSAEFTEEDLDVVDQNEKEELDRILSHDESLVIAKDLLRKQTHKTKLHKRYLVSDRIYYRFVSCLNERMIGNILNNLVNKGLVESGFDNETNDFVFWIKDETNKTEENPETD